MPIVATTPIKTTWKLKGCPRCQGDLYVQHYPDYRTEDCLQCGFTWGNKPGGFLKKQRSQAVR